MQQLGKYVLGRTLGEGNFGKVKYARHIETGESFALKILDKDRILALKVDDQIKREIATLKLLRHPNVVRLHEVLASKSKIYMVLEYVTGGELFDKINAKGRLIEEEGRKLFQQLIDAVSYCHDKGVYHRDLKPENVLVDSEGNIKITDFGLGALRQHFGDDGLLHTTCGSPNYVAPEVLSNRGYDGATSDIWSCGVMLYVILTGYLPFDDRNLAVLYQKILKGDTQYPKWLSPGAKNLIKHILDPNPRSRINVQGIKADEWFKQDYRPSLPDEDEDSCFDLDDLVFEDGCKDGQRNMFPLMNAFQLIGMSSFLDLSGFFEKENASERKIRFTSNYSPKDLFEKIKGIVTGMGYEVQKGNRKLKVMKHCGGSNSRSGLTVAAEVFELSPSLYVVELRKSHGDSSQYREVIISASPRTPSPPPRRLMPPFAPPGLCRGRVFSRSSSRPPPFHRAPPRRPCSPTDFVLYRPLDTAELRPLTAAPSATFRPSFTSMPHFSASLRVCHTITQPTELLPATAKAEAPSSCCTTRRPLLQHLRSPDHPPVRPTPAIVACSSFPTNSLLRPPELRPARAPSIACLLQRKKKNK